MTLNKNIFRMDMKGKYLSRSKITSSIWIDTCKWLQMGVTICAISIYLIYVLTLMLLLDVTFDISCFSLTTNILSICSAHGLDDGALSQCG